MGDAWALRRAARNDVQRLHDVCCIPAVYRYLADDAPPPRAVVEQWIAQGETDAANGLGLWLLTAVDGRIAGCVRLAPFDRARTAELTYLLDPAFWGHGLATRMSWTVVQHAFDAGAVDAIVAGADEPNVASIAVMQRLGMTYLRTVQYPLGTGVEYVYRRGDPAPAVVPRELPMR